MTIAQKLFCSYGAMIALAIATAATSIVLLNGQLGAVANVGRLGMATYHGGVINGSTSDTLIATRDMQVGLLTHDQSELEKDAARYAESDQRTRKSVADIRNLGTTSEIARALDGLNADLNQAAPFYDRFLAAVRAGRADEAAKIYQHDLLPLMTKADDAGTALMGVELVPMSQSIAEAQASAVRGRWLMVVLLFAAVAVGFVLVLIIRALDRQLKSSIAELAESAVQISAAAGQVASSSQSLAQGSSEQAATIEETSSASTEINSMAQRATESSRKTAEIVGRSQQSFESTNQSLNEMVGAMDGIGASSQKISKIIKVIEEIAFQTNILALNAAVEAARAGEAGMGFAVVADEVRNLAQRCSQAAKDTADLIEESIQRSNGGRVKVDEVAVAIRGITAESAQIKILVDEINLGSVEQSRGIEQISRAITQLEQVTQSSAATAEEGAAAAEQLNAQAQAMTDVVTGLRTLVENPAAATPGHAPSQSGG